MWTLLAVGRAVVTLALAAGLASAAAAAELAILTVTPEITPLERLVDGTIEAVNQGTVSAQTSGRVEEIFYDVNDFVPGGAVILRLKDTEQRASLEQAQAALQEAIAREDEARIRYDRIEGLYADRAVSRQQFDAARADRDAAVARLAAARAAVAAAREGVSYTEVRAPYAGVVTQRHVEVGESVRPGTPLMSGLSLQYLRVNAELPQSIVGNVRDLRKAAVYIDGRRIEATGVTIFPVAVPQSNTFRVRVDLPENAADLYPGMFVKTGFVIGETERLLVPVESLVERSEVTGVYVVGDDGHVRLRQIRIGHRFDDRVEVLAGLAPAERIALDPIAARSEVVADHGR